MPRMATILLVEDVDDLAEVVVRELRTEGFEVERGADGTSGLALHAQLRPDLTILDWMLPGMDGLAVLSEIRRTSDAPVLMLTARGEEVDRIIGLEMGADDYLTKPFSLRELVARVRALLRRDERIRAALTADRSREAPEQELRRGPIRLDPRAHRATLDDHELELSPQEFDLLHLFLRNPGRAFSRDYLLDAVWGVDSVPGDRSVDNAILRLRRKLGPAESMIETVWGVGYRLAGDAR
jgi:DNA-binding response OmpR family regulator